MPTLQSTSQIAAPSPAPGGAGADHFWRDVRFAGRTLWKARSFTAIAIMTLALGIGASTAIFSVIENILLAPFPYADSQRFMVIMIHDTDDSAPGGREGFSGPEFLDYSQKSHVFDRVIGDYSEDVLYTSNDGTQRLSGDLVVPNTFDFFKMPALYGRVLQPSDYEAGAAPVFILRYKAWMSYFNGDAGILNRTFVLNGVPRTLVGIMPPRFAFGNADLWIPHSPSRSSELDPIGQTPIYWDILAHLKPGVSIPQAEAELNVLAHQLASVYPKEYPKHFTVQVQSLIDQVVGPFRTTLLLVLAAVGFLLLIACSNVANLLLVRATVREKEFAIRAALGASRWRIIRQLLIESSVLALGGAALGSLLAWAALKTLISLMPPDIIPAEALIRIDSTALLFTLVVTALAATLFGLAPALQVSRGDFNETLRDAGKGTSGGCGAQHSQLRNAIVVLEVAVSLTLLLAAGILMRSFVALRQVNLGFQPDHVLIARLPLPEEQYQTATQLTGFFGPLLDRVKHMPGVVDAAEASNFPPYDTNTSNVEVFGTTHSEKWTAAFQLCSETYFDVLRMRFVEGRGFTASEVNGARKVAVINETFARKYLGTSHRIGQQIRLTDFEQFPDPVHDPSFEIVGIVADAKNQGPQEPALPEVWVPYNVTSSATRSILIRTTRNPLLLINDLRHETWAVNRSVALTQPGSLEQFISDNSYAQPRFGFVLLAVFASVGLVLVIIGVYGVVAYTTMRRTHEIGIRMALGAEAGAVQRMVIGSGLRLVAIGIVLGLIGSFSLSRFIATQVWGVSAQDPATIMTVPLLLLSFCILACWIPARRATYMNPVTALRHE